MDVKTIGQIIGLFAAVMIIGSFQFKKNKYFYVMQLVGNIGFTMHFFLIGAYAGMLLNIFGIIRAVVMLLKGRGQKWAKSNWALAVLIMLCVVCGAATWNSEGWITILPCFAGIVGTVAMAIGDGKTIRLYQLFGVSPLWLIYNITAFSISGIITETFNIVSAIVSIFRFGLVGLAEEK